jgi:beta-glucosidase
VSRLQRAEQDGVEYRDLNGNGRMDPYEDPRRTPEDRTADLLGRLSLAEKVGLLFQAIVGIGDPGDYDTLVGPSRVSHRELVGARFLTHFNLHALPSPAATARWHNGMQELAETTPHGVPITFTSDPRHGFLQNSGIGWAAGDLSQWPEPLGLAAIGDPELVRRFGNAVRREYRALGLHGALHPQIDLATEPRWGRQAQTFGQDAELASRLTVAYLEGMQGSELGPDSVACTTKHFPGGGPQLDGEDPHFPYGREQVYPGGRFEEHLAPFRAAIAAGTSGMMPYYGMPVGLELHATPVDEVGFAFSRRIITGLLRDELGYDGVVLTDFGLLTDRVVRGKPFPARAWGVEHLDPLERAAMILDAGSDQFGGEDRVDLVLELVSLGRVPESRIDEAARRLLLVKFRLGLFDDPYVSESEAVTVVGSPELRAAGHRAQAEAVTVLAVGDVDGVPLLPLRPGIRLYLEGFAPGFAADGCLVVDSPDEAEPRDEYFLESSFHQGSLEFQERQVAHIRELTGRVPVVLDVFLDRPAILTPFDAFVSALVADFGASDAALLDALTGRILPRGRLPFELPRSMAAVLASRTDVPGDTRNPLHPFAAGLDLALPASPSGP